MEDVPDGSVPLARLIAESELVPAIRRRADALDNDTSVLLQLLARVSRAWALLFELPGTLPEGQLLALDRFLSSGIRRQLVAAGVENLQPTPALSPELLDTLTRDAQTRFRGVGKELGEGLAQAILDGMDAGRSGSEIAGAIGERFGVADTRARFLARDLLGSGQAEMTRARHVAAGITRFQWSSAADGNVRPAHRALDGRSFSYEEPPGEGLPGAPYGCRCAAIPLLEG